MAHVQVWRDLVVKSEAADVLLAEIETLRAQISTLEANLVDQTRRADQAMARCAQAERRVRYYQRKQEPPA